VGSSGILWLEREIVGSAGGRGGFLGAFLVLRVFFLMLSRCPNAVAYESGRLFLKDLSVSPGNCGRKSFTSAVSMVEREGLPMAPWA
jgi:hypothetical protein